MKPLSVIILFLLSALTSIGQVAFPPLDNRPQSYNYFKIGKLLWVATNDTVGLSASSCPGAIVYRQQTGDTAHYRSNGIKWSKLSSADIDGIVGLQDSLTAQDLTRTLNKGNFGTREMSLEVGSGQLRFRPGADGTNTIYSYANNRTSFIPLLFASGGALFSDRSGSTVTDDGVSSIQIIGNGRISGTLQGANATAGNHFVTRQQITDTLYNYYQLGDTLNLTDGLKFKINGDYAGEIVNTHWNIAPDNPSANSILFLQNRNTSSESNAVMTIYKPTYGSTENDHMAGIQLIPDNEWAGTPGHAWWYGYWRNEKRNYLTFAGRDDGVAKFPYFTVNDKFLVGIGRYGNNGVDAKGFAHFAPGNDTVPPLVLTSGTLTTDKITGAIEYSSVDSSLSFVKKTQRQKFLFEGFEDTIIVSASHPDAKYATLQDAFDDELSGLKLILLPDTAYNVTDPKLVIKKGWTVRGMGMGHTVIRMTFVAALDLSSSGLHITQDCHLEDLQVITINSVGASDINQYAIHADVNGTYNAVVSRCWFRMVYGSPGTPDGSDYNGLVVGVGSREGQTLEFRNCILEGQTTSLDSRSVLNAHNSVSSSLHTNPSRFSFYNCIINGGFASIGIQDTYAGPDADAVRVKDLFEFIGCDIKGGLFLRTYGKKNGFVFNFAGTNLDEIITADSLVNTSLANYNAASLPVTPNVEYWQNKGVGDIDAGDMVAYVYGDRAFYWNQPTNTISTPIGIEKLTSSNLTRFAGLALTTSAVGDFAHISVGGVAYTSATYPSLSVGQNITIDKGGNIIEAGGNTGIGRIEKKRSTNEIGIRLFPGGKKTNAENLTEEVDNGPVLTVFNSGSTDADGIFVNSPNGTPLKVNVGVNTYLMVNGGGRTLFGNPADDGISTIQASGPAKIKGMLFTSGNGSPEGSVTAPVGSWYSDITNGVPYFKKTGTGNTGWKEITLVP